MGMRNGIQILIGIVVTVVVIAIALARIAFEIIGISTAPDDFALLQQRMPDITRWLFSTPWWVPTFLLLAASAAAAWLIWSGTRKTASEQVSEHAGLSDEEVRALIDKHLQAAAPSGAAVKDADIHRLDERIAELAGKVNFTRGIADATASQFEKLAREFSEQTERWTDWTRQHTESNHNRFKNVDGGFRAIHDRETIARLAEEVRDSAKWLVRPRRGEKVEDWSAWEARRLAWLSKVSDYCDVAEHYIPDVRNKICVITARDLQGDWPEERGLFPSDDAVIAYRTVATTVANFVHEDVRVKKCVASFAFQSPSMKGIRAS
jgi:hypothetical protein